MNKNRIKLHVLAITALLVMGVASCSDQIVDNPSVPIPPVEQPVELKYLNGFCNLNVPSGGDWTVLSYPRWAVPLADSGVEGEVLKLFAETNNSLDARIDTLIVSVGGTKTVNFLLKQLGLPMTIGGEIIDNIDDIVITNAVGWSIDVFNQKNKSSKYNMIGSSPFNLGYLFKALRQNDINEADAVFGEPRFYSRTESVTGTSTNSIANQLSINAGIEVGISAFKLDVSGGYSGSSSSSDKYVYALQEIQHVVRSGYIREGMLRYFVKNPPKDFDIFNEDFRGYIDFLTENPTNKDAMYDMISQYGTHIVTSGTFGGELKLSMQMKVTDQTQASDIHAALGLSAKVVDASGEVKMTSKEENIASNTTISLQSYGGKNVYTITPGTTFTAFQEYVKNSKKMDEWASAIKDGSALHLIDIQTVPIYDLMPTDELRDNLRNYIVNDYQKLMYGNDKSYTGPSLYKITGYDVLSPVEATHSVTLDDINVQIDIKRLKIPELSNDELSTVVYSGEPGKVDYGHGFFVGSRECKPCEFKRNNNGTITIVETYDLLDKDAICELYVDATGDVTIASKTATSLYQTIVMDWPMDIGKLLEQNSESYLIDKNCAITGTWDFIGAVDKKIQIADGVTLTLKGVSMTTAVLQCLGDATIILEKGPEGHEKNVIQGTYSPAIVAGPKGKTLTIKGNGELEVKIDNTDKDSSAAKCAAIGSGADGSSCGDIVISGGTITATGGKESAAIGSGAGGSSCGDITIKKSVIQVTATKGSGCDNAIGAGKGSTCGTVVIEDGAKVIQK